ncbi:MAG: DEAD/DEAH box helicase [Gemmatimonadetes bacterium]|nr:DEAD/DEAH box helicase [Gemmatimonadota bacterium]
MSSHSPVRDHFLPPDANAFRRAESPTGRVIVIAPTRAACETIERALKVKIDTLLEREHGEEIRDLARRGLGFGIIAGTGTGKTLAIRPIAEQILRAPLRVGVVNREREATPETPTWNVVIVTTGIARRWFQGELIQAADTLVVDEIHQTSAELELCLALGKRIGCRFLWLSATVDAEFYARYLSSSDVLETTAFDPKLAARITTHARRPLDFLDGRFLKGVIRERRGVAVFLPTRAEVEEVASQVGDRRSELHTAFYHGGQPIRVIRPFLDGAAEKPFLLAMTAAGQSALNIQGLDTVVIYDARFTNVIERGRNVLTRCYLGANELLQMAGRVHGRVANGEVHILTDREVHFDALRPSAPEFQLGGDSERVAITAAAIGVDLTDLELPVPLDAAAYTAAVHCMTERGIIEGNRLTRYGADVEAMPVDRAWGELLVQADAALIPFLAVMSNVDSLHRMTRDKTDLRGLVIQGSDHLTAYNIFAEAVNEHGYLGKVFGLSRHLFDESLEEWAEERGVLIKAVEDMALGAASVYRTLELPLPATFAPASGKTLRMFQEFVAGIMPFDLVIDEQTASGEPAKVSRGSVCNPWGAVTGTIRFFAGRFGRARAAIEGTNLPLSLIKRFARHSDLSVEYRRERKFNGLFTVQRTDYFGFELDQTRKPLVGTFPPALADAARAALAKGVAAGITDHPHQSSARRALDRLGEYWRRSGGTLPEADPKFVHDLLEGQLAAVADLHDFFETPIRLDVGDIVPSDVRGQLDALPKSAAVFGDRVPLDYEIENGEGVVRLRLREGQARRLRACDLPEVDRPLRYTVVRGKRAAIHAQNLEGLAALLAAMPRKKERHPFGRKHHRGGHRRRR